ncbi:MAG: flagellar biosynthesis protein FlhB [candidate division Zixibacteria bacterium]|nr:flagellar biosynthesis protein FlhB [candidate division Zixibacteria bacterium]
MAEESSSQDKTEEPTPRRISDARQEGQVAKSQELSSVAIIAAGVVTIFVFSSMFYNKVHSMFTGHFQNLGQIDISSESVYYTFQTWGFEYAKIVAPFFLLVSIVAFGISFLQVGPLFSSKAVEPKFDKLNIAKGAKNLVNAKKLFDLFRDSIKIVLIGIVAYVTLDAEMDNYIPLMDQSLGQVLTYGGTVAFKLAIRCVALLLILAILDYAYQKYNYKKSLRMTKQEVKDENKQYEGDPQVKSKIKRIQREQSKKRMLNDVQTADVVVTNPTHIAVALKYDTEKMNAPVVVAKGQRLIAEKIKEVAKKFKVPVVENKPLAQALFKYAEVGMEIPENLYKAVAEVLAYVYRLKKKVK